MFSKIGIWSILSVFIIIHQGSSNPVQPIAAGEMTSTTLVINEVACNFDGHSFIELYSKNGINSELSYGVTVLEVRNKMIRVHSVYELPLVEKAEEFYYVIGDAKEEWKENVDNYQGMTITTSGSNKRFLGHQDQFLQLKRPTFQAIILTESANPFSSVWPKRVGTAGPLLENTSEEFQNYLKNWQTDAVILKYHGVRSTCTKLNLLMPQMTKAVPELPATLGFEWSINLSWNRCGTATFDHLQFKTGELTPGRKNDCTKRPIWSPGVEYLNYPPSNQIEHPCELPSNEEPIVVSEEAITDEDIAAEMFDQMTYQMEGTCPPPSASFRTDMAEDLLPLDAEDAKLGRVAGGPGIDEIPANILDPEAEEKKAKIATAIQQIKEHQNDKINGNLIEKHWEWFNYQFNPTNPESSKYNCATCTRYLKDTIFSNILSKEDGILQPTKARNMRTIRLHTSTLSHKKAVQVEAVKQKESMNKVIAEEIQIQIDEDIETNRDIVLLAYFCARNYNSFEYFTRLVELFEVVGVFMGVSCRTPESAARVSEIISDVILEDFAHDFNNNDGPVQLILDGSESRNRRHSMVLLFQHLGNNSLRNMTECFMKMGVFFTDHEKVVKVTYYKIVDTGVDGTGEALAQLVVEHFRRDGILDAVVRRLKGCTSDGANVMIGRYVSLDQCMI